MAINFADDLIKALSDYSEDKKEEIEKVTNDVSKDMLKEIKKDSPERSGTYKKGWRVKKFKTKGSTENTLYNKTDPQLTHLLENGHVNRDGSRTQGTPHIAPIEKKYSKIYEKKVEEIIGG